MVKLKSKFYGYLDNIAFYLGIESRDTWIPFFAKWFILGLVIRVIAAVFSSGFYDFDEHFQILEFLGTKLHITPADELPWEYQHEMRSWTQVGLYFLITKCLDLFAVHNPITLAFFFRLFTALTGWISLCTLCLSVFFLFKEDVKRKWAIIFLTLAWFIPFIQIRPSSEGLGANMLILGLSMMIFGFMRKKNYEEYPWYLALASGIFLGLSFTFRFQLGFVIMFSWLWAVFIGKIPRLPAFYIAFGIIAMILMEVLVDFWGYGTWTFTPWNYLYQNLFLDKASNFPVSPWWSYFIFSFKEGIPPLSLLLIFSQVLFWIKKPYHLLSWATFPLFLIHTLIPRKAMRFLFPMAVLAPLTLVELPTLLNLKSSLIKKKWVKQILYIMFVLNIILLIIICVRPVRPIVGLYDYIYKQDHIRKIYTQGNGPYHMAGLPVYFYKPQELLVSTSFPKEEKFWYFVDDIKGEITKDEIIIDNFYCSPVYLKYPLFLLKFNIANWQSNSRIWGLLNCKKNNT